MTDWWASLSIELQVFYGIGIISLLITVIQTTLTLVGLGGEAVDLDLDMDMDIPDDAHSSGIGLFSIQTISAFFLGFGWGGVVLLKMGLPLLLAVFLAFNVGAVLMVAMYFMLVGLLSLQSKGNLDYGSAIGTSAEVYVTIPAARAGKGQIQVMVSGRLTTAEAETNAEQPLSPGQNVRITDRIGKTDFLVELL